MKKNYISLGASCLPLCRHKYQMSYQILKSTAMLCSTCNGGRHLQIRQHYVQPKSLKLALRLKTAICLANFQQKVLILHFL